jgi:membrane-bound ClpP family serine protease
MYTLIWPILCVTVGLLLLLSEAFIPSGGLIGLLAIGLIAVGLWMAFSQSLDVGLKFVAALVFLLPAVLMLALYLWPRTPLAKRMFLKPPSPDVDDEIASEHHNLHHLVGQLGRALTTLRPSGMVDFEGKRIDAISEEGLVKAGSLVEAVQVRAGQVVVRQASNQSLEQLLE